MKQFILFLTVMVSWVLIATETFALVMSGEGDIVDQAFRINTPGARAAAMGGAFVGLADDATAAYTNPAGLTILTEPEASFEYKYGNYSNLRFEPDGGYTEYDDNAYGVSFLSYVSPREKATFSLYRHQLLNIVAKRAEILSKDNKSNLLEIDINAVSYGVGTGLKLSETISVGVSIGFAQIDYDSKELSFMNTSFISPEESGSFVAEEDTAEHYTLSLLWSPFNDVNVGFVYRYGPEFTTYVQKYTDTGGSQRLENILKVPDMYAIGMSWQFFTGMTAAFDANYIRYSEQEDDLIFVDGNPPPFEMKKDDTLELHAGIEYVFDVYGMPLAARCGYYFKPQNSTYYDGGNKDPDEDSMMKKTLRKGEDDNIYSIGFGVVPVENIQIDMAASVGDFIKEGVVSFVYRFK